MIQINKQTHLLYTKTRLDSLLPNHLLRFSLTHLSVLQCLVNFFQPRHFLNPVCHGDSEKFLYVPNISLLIINIRLKTVKAVEINLLDSPQQQR